MNRIGLGLFNKTKKRRACMIIYIFRICALIAWALLKLSCFKSLFMNYWACMFRSALKREIRIWYSQCSSSMRLLSWDRRPFISDYIVLLYYPLPSQSSRSTTFRAAWHILKIVFSWVSLWLWTVDIYLLKIAYLYKFPMTQFFNEDRY